MRSAKGKLVYFIVLFLVYLVSFFLFFQKIDTYYVITSLWVAFVTAILIPAVGRKKKQDGQKKD